MNLLGSLIFAGIVVAAIVFFFVQPWRTVANFCSTYESGKQQLLQQWSKEENQGNDSFSKLVRGFATVAGEPTDLVNFFGKLDGVAPGNIEPDIATIKTAFQNENSAMSTAASGNFLGGLGSGLMAGFQSQGAFERVNDYIKKNCDSGLYLQNNTTN